MAVQPQPPAREQQQRQVVVPSGRDEPAPEVRVAAGVATYLRFNAPIDGDSLEVEERETRFKLVDPGEQTLTLVIAVEPGPGERLDMRVRYKDGAIPEYATFFLVSHPTWVDKEVEVVRRPRTVESPSGLEVAGGEGYRASSWALIVFRVRNLLGQKPWAPGEARLTRASDGKRVKVRSVELNQTRLAPGEEGLMAVETEAPFWKTDEVLRLELLDKSGNRLLLIPDMDL